MIIVLNSPIFGSNLQHLREQRGWAREELAQKLDIPADTLAEIEAGRLLDIDSKVLRYGSQLFDLDMMVIMDVDQRLSPEEQAKVELYKPPKGTMVPGIGLIE